MKKRAVIAVVVYAVLLIGLLSSCSHEHRWGEWITSKEASCVAEGERYRVCVKGDCQDRDTDIIERLPHTVVVDEAVLPTCAAVGYTEGSHCSECNLVLIDQREIAMLTEHNYVDGVCNTCSTARELPDKEYSSELPTFYIYTNGAVIPDRSHPDYENYRECDISLLNGEVTEFSETAKIRIRGTSSRWFEKKGYKLKFVSVKSIEGLPESKKYNLLASYPDPCKLRDYLALSISHTMNSNSERYSPLPILSQIYIDDEFQGLYFLLDDIDSGEGKIELEDHTPEDVEIPFILEMDTVAYREGELGVDYFALGRTDVFDYDGDGWTDLLYVIDSDYDTAEQFAYIENYVGSCRQALADGDIKRFSDLVDLASFIDYFLLGELFRNTDMAGRSVYMYRVSADSKLVFGPSWDFDYTCSRPYRLGPNIDFTLDNAKDRFTNYDWWTLFLDIPEAIGLIQERYTIYLRDIFLHELKSAKEFYYFYQDEIKADAALWYSDDVDDINALVDDNFSWTFDYFDMRLEMMDSLFLISE